MKDKDQKPETGKKVTEEKPEIPKEDAQPHKGYNEKNPAQPQGAFTPDSKTAKK